MKKWLALLLSVLVLIGNFSGCQKQKSEEQQLVEEIKNVLECDFSGCEVLLFDRMEIGGESELFSTLYRSEKLPLEMRSVSTAICFLSKRDDGFEIQLLKAKHLSERPAVELLLRRRLDVLQSADMRRYMGEDYRRYLASAAVYCYGNWVIFLATGENDTVLEKLKRLL